MKHLLISILILSAFSAASAQTHECGIVTKNGEQASIVVDEIRAVDALANTLAQRFGVVVSAEEPEYHFAGDFESVRTADPEWSAQNPKVHYVVPKRRRIEINFPISSSGTPTDVPELLRQVIQKSNQQTPFKYRLDIDDGFFTLVPTATRDAKGELTRAVPLLDRRVSIPFGKRTIAEHGKLLADALSAQSGLKVACCQNLIAGIPWGASEVEFGAKDESARKILEQLILLNQKSGTLTFRNYWLVRCDARHCFVDVKNVFGAQCR